MPRAELSAFYQQEMRKFVHGKLNWNAPVFANCGINIRGIVVMLIGMLASADEAVFGLDHGLGDAAKVRRVYVKWMRHGAYLLEVRRGGRYAATTVAEQHSADALARSFELLLPGLAEMVSSV